MHHPDETADLEELRSPGTRVTLSPGGRRRQPGMVEGLGAGADDGRTARHADAVVVRPPKIARVEEPEGVVVLDHRRPLDQIPLPALGRPDQPVGRTNHREPVGRELLRVDRGGHVAAVAVALPEQPRRAVGCDEHARVDCTPLRERAHESRGRVIHERASRIGAGRARDAHCAGLPVSGLDAPRRRRLGQAPERNCRRRRVVHDIGAVRSRPHRRRPLESRDGPLGQGRQRVPEVLAFESRIASKLDRRHVCARRILRGLGVRGVDVQVIGRSQGEGIGEVTVVDRRVVEQPAQDIELHPVGPGGIEADRPLRRQATSRDGELAGAGRGLGLDAEALAGRLTGAGAGATGEEDEGPAAESDQTLRSGRDTPSR